MATLLLRLSGPMQAWGVQSRFRVRDTGREPSKSGVVGLLCAALGRPRAEPVNDLAGLRMAARVDREGRLLRDYHTAGKDGFRTSDGSVKVGGTLLSTRYYLADAVFLVGLESDDRALLGKLHAALRDPVWPLFLGRKAFVPGRPVWLRDGLRDEGLEAALSGYPWLGGDAAARERRREERVRVVADDDDGDELRPDVPLSFAERQFGTRRVATRFWDMPPAAAEEVVR